MLAALLARSTGIPAVAGIDARALLRVPEAYDLRVTFPSLSRRTAVTLDSRRADALDPAVLHLVARTSAAARKYGIPAAVCGALAGDLVAVLRDALRGADE